MIARREHTAGFFARRLGALVAWAALTAAATAAAPVAAAESGDDAGGSPDISARAFSASSSGSLASASGNFSRFTTDLNQVLMRLPPDARRHLVMGALLLFIWLMVRALGRQRAARREKEARERRFRKYAGSPNYPGTDVTVGPGLAPRGRSNPAQPPPKANARPGSIAARLAAEEKAAEMAARAAPATVEAKRAATDELDFATLHKRAVDMPHIERVEPTDADDVPAGVLFDDPFDESELLPEDDPMLVLAGDNVPGADAGGGAELPLILPDVGAPGPAEATTAPQPSPRPPSEPTPAGARRDPAQQAPSVAASRSAAPARIRVLMLKRNDEGLPPVARLVIGRARGEPRDSEVLPRVLAKGRVRAGVFQFAMADEEVRDPTLVGRLAGLVRAAAPAAPRLQVLVDAELAEADVTAVRSFGQALAGEGMALALEATVARNRLPMIVAMTNATHVAFTPEVVEDAMNSDNARAQLGRVIEGVRKRGAHVTLRFRDADSARAYERLGAEAPVWDYLEAAPAGH